MSMRQPEWEGWATVENQQRQRHRFPLMRAVLFELNDPEAPLSPAFSLKRGAITINVSNGGLCLLTDCAPQLGQIVRIHVPMTGELAQTPTLAEVRWVRAVPLKPEGIHMVGLRFVL